MTGERILDSGGVILKPTTETDPIELTTVSDTKMLAETSMTYELCCMGSEQSWNIQVRVRVGVRVRVRGVAFE